MKPESSIDLPQLCLLRLPLLNMDSSQLPSWLCLEIDTLPLKGVLQKDLWQARDRPDAATDCVFDLLQRRHINATAVQLRLKRDSKKESRNEKRMWRMLSHKALLLRLRTHHGHVVMCSYRHMLFNDKEVMKMMAMVNASLSKTCSKNKHTGPRKVEEIHLC